MVRGVRVDSTQAIYLHVTEEKLTKTCFRGRLLAPLVGLRFLCDHGFGGGIRRSVGRTNIEGSLITTTDRKGQD